MRRFLRSIGNALLTVLVMILIVYGWAFIEMKLLLKPQPELFGYTFFLQQEDDMMPDINMNDVVIVKNDAVFNQGDAVLYFDSKDSKYKLHYVAMMDSSSFTVKNSIDNNASESISRNNVVGKAIRKVAFFGAIVSFFRQKVVLLIIGIVGIGFLIVSQYMEFKPQKKELVEK